MIVKLFVGMVICLAVCHAGKSKKPTARTSTSTSTTFRLPADRGLDEWKAMSREALVLQCNALNIHATGSQSALATRLFEHFQNLVANRPINITYRRRRNNNITSTAERMDSPVVHTIPTSNSPLSNQENADTTTQGPNLQEIIRIELRRALAELPSNVPEIPRIRTVPDFEPAAVDFTTTNGFQNGTAEPLSTTALPSPFCQPTATTNEILPPIPSATLLRIRRGEFVNFDNLLPSADPLATDDYSIEYSTPTGGSKPKLSLVSGSHGRPKITDFTTWLSAWNIYLQAMVVYHPHLCSQLVSYQTTITRFSTQYSMTAVLTYDRLFRYYISNKQLVRWDAINDNLFNLYVRCAPKTLCYTCRSYGHISSNCPQQKGQNSHNSYIPTSVSATGVSGNREELPFRAPQRQPSMGGAARMRTCFFYNNRRGQCEKRDCPYPHKCRQCFGPHPESDCPTKRSR